MTKQTSGDYPVPFTFRASTSTAEMVREHAAREGKTMSDVIRETLNGLAQNRRGTRAAGRPSPTP